MPNEDVVFKVTIDDSTVEKGMNDAKKKVTKAANETAEVQKKSQDSVSDNAKANNDKIVNDTEKADRHVKQSANDTAEACKKAQDDTAKNAEENDKKIVDSAEKTHKSITDTASREGDNVVRKDKEKTEQLKKHQSDYEEKAKKTAENVKKFYVTAGAAIVAETTAAIIAAANYQTSYAKVFTLTSDGTDEIAYANSIKQASKNTGVKVTDMSESVYSAISASVDQDKAVGFTEDAVKLAKGGFTDTATSVDVLTTAINAYGLAADDASHISDVLINTQNKGKTTVDELARSMGQTIPVANAAHTAIEELSTDYAVLTKNGVATAEAGTQIKAMYSELNASGTQVSKTLREITGKSFAELKDEGHTTADVLNRLSDYAAESGQKLSDLFGSVEAGSAALTLVKDGGKDFAEILNSMTSASGATEAAYEKMTNTLEAKADKFVNKISIMFAEAGEEMLPLIDDLIDYVDENSNEIEDIIKGIGELMKNVIIVAGDTLKVLWEHKEAVAAVAAAFVAYKTAIAISSVIDKFKTATEGATIAQKALNIAMSANPAGLIAAGIAALTVGLVSLEGSIGTSTQRVGELSNEVKGLADNAKSAVKEQKQLSDVASEYERINSTVSDASRKKEELIKLQETLINQYGQENAGIDLVNGSYEENIKLLKEMDAYKRERSLNQINSDLAAAKKDLDDMMSMRNSTVFGDTSAMAESSYNALEKFSERYADRIASDGKAFMDSIVGYGATAFSFDFDGDVEMAKEVLDDLLETIYETGESRGALSELYNSVYDYRDTIISTSKSVEELEEAQRQLTDGTYDTADAEDEAASSASNLADKTNEIAIAEKSLEEIVDDLNGSAKDLIDQYGSLYDSLKDLENGGALNYDQMMKLVEVYPELADKIKLTADGYTIEADALNDLGIAVEDRVNTQIEEEKKATRVAIEESKKRLEAYKEEYKANAARWMMEGKYEEAAKAYKDITDTETVISQLEAKLGTYDTLPDYIKGNKGKRSSSGDSSSSDTKKEENENEKNYDKEYATLKYQHDMGEIDDAAFYKGVADLRDNYLEKDSDKWRAANVSIHNYEESLKKNGSKSTSSSSKTGTVISIDSYIPTVWDTEEEKIAKLKKGAELDLAGGDMYKSNIRSIKDSASTVGSTISSSAVSSTSSSSTATLSDVVDAIKDIQTADEHKKISFEVEFRARDLSLGKVVVADLNDMTRINGKTPLIIK